MSARAEAGADDTSLPKGSVPRERMALRPGAIVITDLHLAPLGDARSDEFGQWCDQLLEVPELVCLGDLFDTWVGAKQAKVTGTRAVLDAIARLGLRGTRVFVVPGNRDALLDGAFERASGATLFPEGFIGELPGGENAAFVHGDGLCTLDRGYQRLRRVWRARSVRFVSRHAPLWFARWIGGRLRSASEDRKPLKLPEEKSIRPAAVAALAEAAQVNTVVCGHAHQARDERLACGVRWMVVGEFGFSAPDALIIGERGELERASAQEILGKG